MMKLLFYIFFMILVCIKGFNFIQVFLFYALFLMIIDYWFFSHFMFLSFMFGVDGVSYFMSMLSIWISALMFMASLKIYFKGNYSVLFSFVVLILLMVWFLLLFL